MIGPMLPLFGEGNPAESAGLGALVGAGVAVPIIGAIAAAVVLLLNAKHKADLEKAKAKQEEAEAGRKARKEDQADAIDYWQKIVKRLDEEIGALKRHIGLQDRQIDELQKEVARCRAGEKYYLEDMADQRATILAIYDFAAELYEDATAGRKPTKPLPPRPAPRPPRAPLAEAEFAQAEQKQTAGLLRKEAEEQKSWPPPSRGDREPPGG